MIVILTACMHTLLYVQCDVSIKLHGKGFVMKVAIMGFGTIGSGVFEVASANNINIVKVLDLRDLSTTIAKSVWTKDFNNVLNSDADVVVECMGGEYPAYEFVRDSLKAGKSVVTSNKALVAAYGEELAKLAKDNNVKFLFEASVGGGIPIIRVINECLACDDIFRITGILNGTTNYILTQMDNGMEYADAFKKAQELGYAEADPSADVDGWDTCRKIVILGWLISGKMLDYRNVPVEGITKITKADIDAAKADGKVIKLLGCFEKNDDGIKAYVKPVVIDKEHELFAVSGVMNAVLLESKYLGKSMYYGAGAGKLATATAVVADIMKC